MPVTDKKCSKFQKVAAENHKACLEKSVFMNSWTSSGMTDECSAVDTFHDSPFR